MNLFSNPIIFLLENYFKAVDEFTSLPLSQSLLMEVSLANASLFDLSKFSRDLPDQN
jgi:hypothetical protein